MKSRMKDYPASLSRPIDSTAGRLRYHGKMKRHPIGYLSLCEALLDEGVPVYMIKKHRFVLQALAASMYTDPVDIDHDHTGFFFAVAGRGRSANRRVGCTFQALSGIATVTHSVKDGEVESRRSERLSLTSAPGVMLWLFPIEDDFTWWERVQIWLERAWLWFNGAWARLRKR